MSKFCLPPRVVNLVPVIVDLLRAEPSRVSTLEEKLPAYRWHEVHDAVFEAVQRGLIRIRPDSVMEVL